MDTAEGMLPVLVGEPFLAVAPRHVEDHAKGHDLVRAQWSLVTRLISGARSGTGPSRVDPSPSAASDGDRACAGGSPSSEAGPRPVLLERQRVDLLALRVLLRRAELAGHGHPERLVGRVLAVAQTFTEEHVRHDLLRQRRGGHHAHGADDSGPTTVSSSAIPTR